MNPGKNSHRKGFSLVELLVVISVIGIIVGIGIPSIGNVYQNAMIKKNQRNAQSISSTAGAALAAGADLNTNSIEVAINQLKNGINGGGDFVNSVFKVAPFSNEEIAGALPYLTIEDNSVIYRSVPNNPVEP